jgi:hypothetical protein
MTGSCYQIFMMNVAVSHLTHEELTAALIVHLGEFDARRLYEPAGYPSLFKYCMAVLHISEDAVYNGIEVARAVRRHPVLAEMLVTGALSPTTARLVVDSLTVENEDELLAAAAFKSKHAVEELLVHVCPRPDVSARVRKIPRRPLTDAEVVPPVAATAMEPAATPTPDAVASPSQTLTPVMTAPPDPRPVVRPRAPDRYEIRFTASKEMRDELRERRISSVMPSRAATSRRSSRVRSGFW